MENSGNFILDMALSLIIILLGIVSYFLRQKDVQHEKYIHTLFEKHDEDVIELHRLREQVASDLYNKRELDRRFEDLAGTFREVGRSLEGKLDEMQKAMFDHVVIHHSSKGDRQ